VPQVGCFVRSQRQRRLLFKCNAGGGIGGVCGITQQIKASRILCIVALKHDGRCAASNIHRIQSGDFIALAIDLYDTRSSDVEHTQFTSLQKHLGAQFVGTW